MAEISTLVRSARRARKLTQRDLADRSGVPQSRVALVEGRHETPRFDTASRLLAAGGHRLYAAATTRDDVATVAAAIRSAVKRDDARLAFRYFIQMNDNLVAERGLLRGVLAITEPETTGSKTWDSAIAALVAYRLNAQRVPLPPWVHAPERSLERARVLQIDPADPAPPRGDVPTEFLEHGVLIWRDSLESV
ncbi:helix-turn-helix domain-containing protein [Agromyces albus]|uniref:Helix-turn-helix domain-containing protein n=1 Tax=Agromyces albus TaxID=205332 RepID=A0A4Q2L431_9MICO|nr:helix-turn-helix domain-containing protein [Agromyces albus]RXZ72955.1 helix-turn-helix domain-containing protein [Agromyces albus]